VKRSSERQLDKENIGRRLVDCNVSETKIFRALQPLKIRRVS